MRAYLSTPNAGPIFYEGDVLCYADGRTFAAPYAVSTADQAKAAAHAELEARRILADTEPRIGNYSLVGIQTFRRSAACRGPLWAADRAAGRALAESLARWIAE